MQKKVQGLYRKIKQERREAMEHLNDYSDIVDIEDNKIGRIIVRICVVLGILVLVLNAFIKEF